ncbi:MAG: FAD/NAD(P)-binding protein [Candidatus Baldrarchaeia archaeon]
MANPYVPHPAVIKEIKTETRDTKTFRLEFLDENVKKAYQFKPGQFNMVGVFGVGEAPFSITSNPDEKEYFEHTIRAVGNVTNTIHKLKEGDILWVRGPYGRPWPIEEAKGKNILIVAGGLGLAPLRPVIYYIANHRDEFGYVEVLYGARTPLDMLYRSEMDEWRKIKDFTLRLTVDMVPEGVEWEHRVGVVTVLFEEMDSRPENTVVMVCGPEIMMHFVVKGLVERGFAKNQIYLSMERRMHCGIGKCGHCQIGSKFVCRDGPVFTFEEVEPLPDKIV